MQTIIATISQRVKDSSETAAFFFAPIAHEIVANSRPLIKDFHVSPDDALHLYTGWIYNCDYFLIHDYKIINSIRSKVAEGMAVIDLDNETDRTHVAAQLGLSAFE